MMINPIFRRRVEMESKPPPRRKRTPNAASAIGTIMKHRPISKAMTGILVCIFAVQGNGGKRTCLMEKSSARFGRIFS